MKKSLTDLLIQNKTDLGETKSAWNTSIYELMDQN